LAKIVAQALRCQVVRFWNSTLIRPLPESARSHGGARSSLALG